MKIKEWHNVTQNLTSRQFKPTSVRTPQLQIRKKEAGMVVHVCRPGTWEVETAEP